MPYFTQEQRKNKHFLDQALSFDAMGTYPDGISCGAFPQENGDVQIRLHINGGQRVQLYLSVSNTVQMELELIKTGKDLFEGLIPYRPDMTGPANVRVLVNGAEVLVPDLPIIWTDNRPQNNVELPAPDMDYLLVKNVPHGTLHREMIFSHATGDWERCMVYTPASYAENQNALPVLYLLHGGGDNELMWEYVGKVSSILDNLWAEGKAEPFVVVTMNGMVRAGGKVAMPVDETFQRTLLEDCIPFIQTHYRVKTDKWNRAIAGLSMGAYMSCDICFQHPELFGYLGTFTASMSQEPTFATYLRPYPRMLQAGPEAFAQQFRLYWRSTTPQENRLDFFLTDDALLQEAGIYALPCHHRRLYSPDTSKWNSWRMGLRDFAQQVFR